MQSKLMTPLMKFFTIRFPIQVLLKIHLELQTIKMRNGQLGLVHLGGQHKGYGNQDLMELTSILPQDLIKNMMDTNF